MSMAARAVSSRAVSSMSLAEMAGMSELQRGAGAPVNDSAWPADDSGDSYPLPADGGGEGHPSPAEVGQRWPRRSSRRSLYSTESTRACHEASMMLSATPTVPHVSSPSPDVMSTRVRAAVPLDSSRMRTL